MKRMSKTYREKYNRIVENLQLFGGADDSEFIESINYGIRAFIKERFKENYKQGKLIDIVEEILAECQAYIDIREGR